FGPEIGAPRPAGHVALNGSIERVDADFAVAAENDWLHVACVELVAADDFGRDAAELLDGVGKLHAVNARGIDQALHVLAEAENRGTPLGVVAADAFEDRGAVADNVGKDVKGSVVPLDPISVVPNLFCRCDWHDVLPFELEPFHLRIRYGV